MLKALVILSGICEKFNADGRKRKLEMKYLL